MTTTFGDFGGHDFVTDATGNWVGPEEIPAPPPAGPGPVIALLFRSVAEHVAGHPYGVYELPDVVEAATAMLEVVESQLVAAEAAAAERPGQYYSRRLLGRLGPDEPVYVQVGELAETGALPHRPEPQAETYHVTTLSNVAVGVSWDPRLGLGTGTPGLHMPRGWEECARHAVANLPRTLGLLDIATLGLVLYDEVCCATCEAEHQVELCPGSEQFAPVLAVSRSRCDDCGQSIPLAAAPDGGAAPTFARHSRLVDVDFGEAPG